MTVATNRVGDRQDRADPRGLDGALHSLRTLGPWAPSGCTWACSSIVDAVRERVTEIADCSHTEFEAVLVRRWTDRYVRVVGDGAAGRPVAQVWRLLLDPPPSRPAELAVAGMGALLGYDLTLAAVGACTVLGRAPGAPERAAHHRVAALLGVRARELARADQDAARLDSSTVRDAAWCAVEHLWALRGRPVESDDARDALDRAAWVDAVRVLRGAR